MNWSDIPWHPSRRTLRHFAALWLAFFTCLGLWHGHVRDRPGLGLALATVALAVGIVGLASPSTVRPIFVTWLVLAFPIGWMVSRLMLAALFYGLFTPLAMAFRWAGRDALRLQRDRTNPKSYWLPNPAPASPERYYRQF